MFSISFVCCLFRLERSVSVLFSEFTQREMATDNLLKVPNWSSAHWKASDDTGFVVYVLQLLIMYQSHQVLDSLCSLSLLAPWLPQLSQTVNKVPKQQGLSVPLLIFNNVLPPKRMRNYRSPKRLTAPSSPLQNSPLNCCLISGLCRVKFKICLTAKEACYILLAS